MRQFEYIKATDIEMAIDAVASHPDASFLAGGTNLVDLMKLGVKTPTRVVDINKLPLTGITDMPHAIRIGALEHNSDVACHPLVQANCPLLAQALLSGASPQLRNMATIGGNLLQRTRCYYFNDITEPCNKRSPGSGCPALTGQNRLHAILGTSSSCIATHPSDMCVALAALDAIVHTQGPQGERQIPLSRFYVLPETTPDRETILTHGELITAVAIPKSSSPAQSLYIKIRDRASYAFALVSVAVILEVQHDQRIQAVRIALGGVAPKPWRCYEAEAFLRNSPLSRDVFTAAASLAVATASSRGANAFKHILVQRALVRALSIAGGLL